MVRLVVTDFLTKEDNEAFYLNDEFDVLQKVFTYYSFKKYSVYLSKYDMHDQVYSLNILSKKHLDKNQFLIYIADGEYYILFNHKTVYSAKINKNFITDDMIKSILITKHIAMLSSGGAIEKIYYITNAKYKYASENILKQNTRNEKNEQIAICLGEIDNLVESLNPLESFNTYISKIVYTSGFILGVSWFIFFGLNMISDKFFPKEALENLKREIQIESRLTKRQEIILSNGEKKYNEMTDCISTKVEEKWLV